MAKYSLRDKLEMVIQYLNGIGSTTISNKYNVNGSATVLYWVKAYQKDGIRGLEKYPIKHIYTMKDRINILNWMKTTKSSYP